VFIIVVGCGRVGAELAFRLYQRGHQVAVIDQVGSSFANLDPEYRGRTIGVVYQSFNLIPSLTSLDNVAVASWNAADTRS